MDGREKLLSLDGHCGTIDANAAAIVVGVRRCAGPDLKFAAPVAMRGGAPPKNRTPGHFPFNRERNQS